MSTLNNCHCRRDNNTATYMSWQSMKKRCLNPNNQAYANYGLRGITVCKRWMNDFNAFLRDMGEQPPGMSLERINNNEGYSPSNCWWATKSEQARNRRQTVILTFNGKTQCQFAWELELGLSKGALYYRRKKGWSLHRTLTTKQT